MSTVLNHPLNPRRDAFDDIERAIHGLRGITDLLAECPNLHTVQPDHLAALIDVQLDALQHALDAARN